MHGQVCLHLYGLPPKISAQGQGLGAQAAEQMASPDPVKA